MNRDEVETVLNELLHGTFSTPAQRDLVRIAYLRGYIDGIQESRKVLRPITNECPEQLRGMEQAQ